jgi:methylphosphotriester-DNA--protein-cysteine methyltransferase
VGNSATHFFHRASCPNAIKMRISRQVAFETARDALDAGYKPCGICKP